MKKYLLLALLACALPAWAYEIPDQPLTAHVLLATDNGNDSTVLLSIDVDAVSAEIGAVKSCILNARYLDQQLQAQQLTCLIEDEVKVRPYIAEFEALVLSFECLDQQCQSWEMGSALDIAFNQVIALSLQARSVGTE